VLPPGTNAVICTSNPDHPLVGEVRPTALIGAVGVQTKKTFATAGKAGVIAFEVRLQKGLTVRAISAPSR
jgi:hypothetical protein